MTQIDTMINALRVDNPSDWWVNKARALRRKCPEVAIHIAGLMQGHFSDLQKETSPAYHVKQAASQYAMVETLTFMNRFDAKAIKILMAYHYDEFIKAVENCYLANYDLRHTQTKACKDLMDKVRSNPNFVEDDRVAD